MKKKFRLTLAALCLAVAAGSAFPVAADVKAPGQCKKQGPSNCAGESECHGPHFALLPLGQQKKC